MACIATALAAGCGDDDAGSCMVDACVASPDGGALGGTAADIPWLEVGAPPIEIAPCHDGWREIAPDVAGDPVTCDPYPEGGPAECPDGEAHFPGEERCVPVGSPCPSGEFAAGLPADRRVVYVQPGSIGGDGTEARPYGSLSEFGFGGLPTGAVIALSRGTHDGPVRLSRRHELVGACAAATVLRAAAPSVAEGVVTLFGEGGVVRDLTLADSPRVGLQLDGVGVEGLATGLDIQRMEGLAVAVFDGAHLSLEAAVVRDTAARASDGAFGRGVNVERGFADLRRVVVLRNRDLGVFVGGPVAAITMTDVAVRDTEEQPNDGTAGRGLNLQRGGVADVNRAFFGGNHEASVYADVGSEVTLSDIVVRDTEAQASDGGHGRGLGIQTGAMAAARRALIANNRQIGVFAGGTGTTVTLTDVVIRDTASGAADGDSGRGLAVQSGAVMELTRGLLSNNREFGVIAAEVDTRVSLTDVVVRGTESRRSSGRLGRGLSVQNAAAAQVARAVFAESRELGVSLLGGDVVATFADVIIARTLPRACAETTCADSGAGHGLGVYDPGTAVRVERFGVQDAALCGVHLGYAAELDLEDGDVTDSAIGLCMEVDGYDLARLTTAVRYERNGVNLQSTSLPVPEPGELLPSADP